MAVGDFVVRLGQPYRNLAHMIFFAFNPVHWYQLNGNSALVWDAILGWDAL